MMTAAVILEIAIKSLIVAGGALIALKLIRKRSAAERSWIAHLGLIGLVLLPAAVLIMPSWNPLPKPVATVVSSEPMTDISAIMPTIARADTATPAAGPPGGEVQAAALALPSAGELAVWVYAIPAILLLLTMLVAVVRLGAMHRRANVLVDPSWLSALAQAQRRMGFKHGTALLVSSELRSPVSWGLMRPIILLNERTLGATGEAEAIIAHELAHVARLDWAKLLVARAACALFWFNPLVWRLAREAHQLREESADDAVLLSEIDSTSYAELLVNAARHDNQALLIAAHGVAPGKDSLKRRITRVLDGGLARGPAGRAWTAVCVASLAAVAMPLAAFDPAARVDDSSSASIAASERHALEKLPGKWFDRQISSAFGQVDAEIAGSDKAEAMGDNREIDDLIAYKAVDMNPEFIRSLRSGGFEDASMEDLVDAKAVGVTADYARQVRSWDPGASLEDVVAARAVGVSPVYFGEMRSLFRDATLEEISDAKAVGVTADFARTVRGWDRAASLENVTEVRALGVSAAYYGEMRSIFRDAGLDEVAQLAALGIDGTYAREMKTLFPGADADDMVEMKAVGVTPAFVREMRRQGLSARDTDDVVEARVLSGGLRTSRNSQGSSPSALAIAGEDGSRIAISKNGMVIRSGADGSGIVIGPDGMQIKAPPAPPNTSN